MKTNYWNPYLGGVILGTVLFLSFIIAAQGFGASGTFSRLTSQYLVNSDPTWLNNDYVKNYFKHSDNALLNWTVLETIGVLLGGFISALFARRLTIKPDKAKNFNIFNRFILAFIGGAIIAFGSRFTRGCTSGQGLDGMATFSVGAWIFMLSVFGAALIVAPIFSKQWVDDSKGEE